MKFCLNNEPPLHTFVMLTQTDGLYTDSSGAFTGGTFELKSPVRLFWDPKNNNTPPYVLWIREYETRCKGNPCRNVSANIKKEAEKQQVPKTL